MVYKYKGNTYMQLGTGYRFLKIGTLSVHVSAHDDCTVAKGFNQYSVACKNFKGLMFNSWPVK